MTWPAVKTGDDADGIAAGEFAAPRGANGVLGAGDSPAGAGIALPAGGRPGCWPDGPGGDWAAIAGDGGASAVWGAIPVTAVWGVIPVTAGPG
jgi:hypothetical protein